jgi:hypothetical protein
MCEPVTATAAATSIAAGTTAAAAAPVAAGTLAAAGPGMFAVAPAFAGPGLMAAGTAAVPGAIGFAPLGASFTSIAPSASLFSSLGAIGSSLSGALPYISPLASAAGALSSFGSMSDMEAMGRLNAEVSMINMNQQLIEAQRRELERREQVQASLAAIMSGETQGQSMVALADKKVKDAKLSKGLFETQIGQIGVVGRTDTANIDYRTQQRLSSVRSSGFETLGRAAGQTATALSD